MEPDSSRAHQLVLVVDDERPIVDAVVYNLRREGFETLAASDAEECLALVRMRCPDLIILDVMLPSATGFDVCRLLRKQGVKTPVIMLTARAEETDRVVGLEIGADDYVTKPFSMRELMARARSILRRTASAGTETPDVVRIDGVVIDAARHTVSVDGRAVELTLREFALLRFMASHAGHVYDRATLLDRVWGDSYLGDRTVDVHIRWLREKIEQDPANPTRILTVRGIGYKYAEPR